MTKGLPLWRLRASGGQVTDCYVDATGPTEWMLTVWSGATLLASEVHPSPQEATARAIEIQSVMLADGWTDLEVV